MKVALNVLTDGFESFVERCAKMCEYLEDAPDDDPVLVMAREIGEIDPSTDVEIVTEIRDGTLAVTIQPTGPLAEVLAAYEARA